MATLNALAQFSGYQNWRVFTSNDFQSLERKVDINSKSTLQLPFKKLLFITGFILLVIFIGFRLFKKQTKHLTFRNVKFTSKPVTLGLPNTVIFQYDASNSNADSVFIQQSWDSRRRFKVDKQLHEYTSMYYLPGYYRAKIILDDSIVMEHDVHIETVGWVGIIENNTIPVYLPKNLFQNQNQMGISEKELLEQKIDFEKEAPVFTITKVDKSFDLSSKKFSLQVQLQNTYNKSNGICQYSNVLLLGTSGVIDIPLCNIGCVGEVGLMLGMKYIDGKTNDLSGFGVDFTKNVKLNCEAKNQIIKIWVNDSIVYTTDFKQNIGRIVGAKIKFKGTGFVRYFELNEGK